MGGLARKLKRNAEEFEMEQIYKNMTPDLYRQSVNLAIKKAEERVANMYEKEMIKLAKQYNNAIQEGTLMAMDTLAVEILYELGNMLECYIEEPEFLEQKIEIIQKLYETAMNSIKDYASPKYKNDKQAQKTFAKKKKTIKKLFNIY